MVIVSRYLNSQTQDNQAPFLVIEDMLERHERHKNVSVLDLKHAFHQMPLHPHDRYVTARPTPLATLCWRVLFMGVKHVLRNSSASWIGSSTTNVGRLWTVYSRVYMIPPLRPRYKLTTGSPALFMLKPIIRISDRTPSGLENGVQIEQKQVVRDAC